MNRLLIGLLLSCTLLVSCGRPTQPAVDVHGHEEEQTHEESVNLTKDQEKIAGITTEVVRSEPVQSELTVPGTVAAIDSGRAVVTPPVSGRLVKLSARLGDSVKKGQTIGIIESTELAEAWAQITSAEQMRDQASARIKDAQSEAKLAQSTLQSAEQTLARQKEFAKAGAFNTAALQQSQRELNDAQNDLLSAQKELATHRETLRRLDNLYKEGLVAKADLQEAQLEVQKDEIEVARSESAVRLAKSAYDREKNIADQGLQNSKEVQSAESEVRQARLNVDRAKNSVTSAQSALAVAAKGVANARSTYRTYSGGAASSGGRVTLIAPISGVIAHLDVTQGQAVDRTQVLCEIENLNTVWVTANVPEKDVSRLKVGNTALIVSNAFPDDVFEGVIQVIGSALDPKTRSVPVRCLVVNSGKRLKPEMFAEVKLAYGLRKKSLTVPVTAVVPDGEEQVIFVLENKEFVRHVVEVGRTIANRVEILSGIDQGQVVASEGAFILKSQLAKDELKGHDH